MQIPAQILRYLVTVRCPDQSIKTGLVVGDVGPNHPLILVCAETGVSSNSTWQIRLNGAGWQEAIHLGSTVKRSSENQPQFHLLFNTFFPARKPRYHKHWKAFDPQSDLTEALMFRHSNDGKITGDMVSLETISGKSAADHLVGTIDETLDPVQPSLPNGVFFGSEGNLAGFTNHQGEYFEFEHTQLEECQNIGNAFFDSLKKMSDFIDKLTPDEFDQVIVSMLPKSPDDVQFNAASIHLDPEVDKIISRIPNGGQFKRMFVSAPANLLQLCIHITRDRLRKHQRKNKNDYFDAINQVVKIHCASERGMSLAFLLLHNAGCSHLQTTFKYLKNTFHLFQNKIFPYWLNMNRLLFKASKAEHIFQALMGKPSKYADEIEIGIVHDGMENYLGESVWRKILDAAISIFGQPAGRQMASEAAEFINITTPNCPIVLVHLVHALRAFTGSIKSLSLEITQYLEDCFPPEYPYPYSAISNAYSLSRFWLVPEINRPSYAPTKWI